MSHVVSIVVEYKDEGALKEALSILGLELRDKTTYNWYGKHVGDYPIPAGFTKQDLGKCEFAFGVPGDEQAYELGVVRRRDGKEGFAFLFDFWGDEGAKLEKKIGPQGEWLNGGKLKQAYTAATTERTLQAKGYYTSRVYSDDGSIEIIAETETARRWN